MLVRVVSWIVFLDQAKSQIRTPPTAEMDVFIKSVSATERPDQLVAVDQAIVGPWPATEVGFAEELLIRS
ncbi:MAG: hypothetical protein ACREBG_01060 [Pyrinomonadaceae bacterium]